MYLHKAFPYTSQWTGPTYNRRIVYDGMDPCLDPDWVTHGFTEEQYRFWARRLCGLACLESILRFIGRTVPRRQELWRSACEAGAYVRTGDVVQGLIYQPFADWTARDYQLQSRVLTQIDLAAAVALVGPRRVCMLSVSPEIRRADTLPTKRGGHLVVVFGFDANDRVWFMNPSGTEASAPWVSNLPKETFDRFFARRGLSIAF